MSHKQEITEPNLEAEEAKELEIDQQSKPTRKKSAIRIFLFLIICAG
jgi:hypothetical protein